MQWAIGFLILVASMMFVERFAYAAVFAVPSMLLPGWVRGTTAPMLRRVGHP